ncbi:MAG: hypothetical protein IRZ02_04020 [Acidothermus sp.]|nr:hypothetical protein [Acidothermus sp.]MCL6537314.1 hypothetical protein [Acidothermus sp.]
MFLTWGVGDGVPVGGELSCGGDGVSPICSVPCWVVGCPVPGWLVGCKGGDGSIASTEGPGVEGEAGEGVEGGEGARPGPACPAVGVLGTTTSPPAPEGAARYPGEGAPGGWLWIIAWEPRSTTPAVAALPTVIRAAAAITVLVDVLASAVRHPADVRYFMRSLPPPAVRASLYAL